MADERDILLQIIEESYRRPAWHGPNLRGSLRGVSTAIAAWRFSSQQHNIWEIVVHAAYWKYVTWRRLTSEMRSSFPFRGSNWFLRDGTEGSRLWRADLKLLDAMHERIVAILNSMSLAQIRKKSPGRNSVARLLYGIAQHDVYHAGQIQLLKRMAKESLG